MDCLGCRIANQLLEDTKVVFEDERIVCILDKFPLLEGHVLILPKAHFNELEEVDEPTLNSVMRASAKISKALKGIYKPEGVMVLQYGGALNELNHYHMHVFPRFKDDGLFEWGETMDTSDDDLEQVQVRIKDELKSF